MRGERERERNSERRGKRERMREMGKERGKEKGPRKERRRGNGEMCAHICAMCTNAEGWWSWVGTPCGECPIPHFHSRHLSVCLEDLCLLSSGPYGGNYGCEKLARVRPGAIFIVVVSYLLVVYVCACAMPCLWRSESNLGNVRVYRVEVCLCILSG